MLRRLRHTVWYDRLAICFIVLCTINLYILALTRGSSAAFVQPPRTIIDVAPGAAPFGGVIKPASVSVVLVRSADKLAHLFERIGYRLDGVRRHGEVPRLFVASLPVDLTSMRSLAERKTVFIRAMLPLILQVNEGIRAERRRVAGLRILAAAGVPPGSGDAAWLAEVSDGFGADAGDFAELLRRMDTIPPSLALAQAAVESGWGTSRFAREGNALFGQRTYRGAGGIVPLDRGDGETHRVRSFSRLIDGVRAYMHNLNTHAAYAGFRAEREQARVRGAGLDSDELAGTLSRYSERGDAYVESVRAIIRANGLKMLDRARFGDEFYRSVSTPDA